MKTEKELYDYARNMALKPSVSEQVALELVQLQFVHEVDFKFQEVFGCYILDFVIPSKMLVIELDGREHNTCKHKHSDAVRDRICKHYGLRVLRIKNADAQFILEKIAAYNEVYDGYKLWNVAWLDARQSHKRRLSNRTDKQEQRTKGVSRPEIGHYYAERWRKRQAA